jgi:hypothetical protein
LPVLLRCRAPVHLSPRPQRSMPTAHVAGSALGEPRSRSAPIHGGHVGGGTRIAVQSMTVLMVPLLLVLLLVVGQAGPVIRRYVGDDGDRAWRQAAQVVADRAVKHPADPWVGAAAQDYQVGLVADLE